MPGFTVLYPCRHARQIPGGRRRSLMDLIGSVKRISKRTATRVLPVGAVGGVLAVSLFAGTPGIIGLGVGYDYGGPNCTAANVTNNSFSGTTPGTVVTFTATATACTHPEFQWYLAQPGQQPGAGFVAVTGFQPYPQNTFTWNTTGLAPGNYGIGV